MSREGVVFWSVDDVEYLKHESIDDAVIDYIDGKHPCAEELIIVTGYSRKQVDKEKLKKIVIESVYEYLAENHDGEDGHEYGEKDELAATEFIEKYLEGYTSWQCVECCTVEVIAKEWIEKNRPEWSAL